MLSTRSSEGDGASRGHSDLSIGLGRTDFGFIITMLSSRSLNSLLPSLLSAELDLKGVSTTVFVMVLIVVTVATMMM